MAMMPAATTQPLCASNHMSHVKIVENTKYSCINCRLPMSQFNPLPLSKVGTGIPLLSGSVFFCYSAQIEEPDRCAVFQVSHAINVAPCLEHLQPLPAL